MAAVLTVCALCAGGALPVLAQHADQPERWLVLYNLDNPESWDWANWYQKQWGIPDQNFLGLHASDSEHLPSAQRAQMEVVAPVREYLNTTPSLHDSIMGIVVGYGLPGNFGTTPSGPSIGGWSIVGALQDMTDDTEPQLQQKDLNYDNPILSGRLLPAQRLTRSTMLADRYMTARIDAPTLEEAKDLTRRAKFLSRPTTSLQDDHVFYDYYDPQFPIAVTKEWYWLKDARLDAQLAELPWAEFDLDGVDGPIVPNNDAFRFAIYKLNGWTAADFVGDAPGSRVLAYSLNSWGGVAVRSTDELGGLYVPNAIAGGYAAAIGSTAEPNDANGPFPDTLLAALMEGWTLGEAFYLANPYDDFMWTLVGDPLLTLPNGFDPPVFNLGDINLDGRVNARDFAGMRACLEGANRSTAEVCGVFDFDTDGDVDLYDLASFQRVFTGGEVSPVTGDADGDGVINITDYTAFAGCSSAPTPQVLDLECSDAFDFDFDLDIDAKDYARFQTLYQEDVVPLAGD